MRAAILVLVLLVSGCVSSGVQPVKQAYLLGDVRNFRADLTEVPEVPVSDPDGIIDLFLDPNLTYIKISFMPDNYTAFYAATGFEVANKLAVAYKFLYGRGGAVVLYDDLEKNITNCFYYEATAKKICINAVPVRSPEDVENAETEATILFLPSNTTEVVLDGRTVILRARSFDETERDYTDLDLAADRFLLLILNYLNSTAEKPGELGDRKGPFNHD